MKLKDKNYSGGSVENSNITAEMKNGRRLLDTMGQFSQSLGKRTTEVAKKTSESIVKGKDAVLNAMDQNGDGQVGIDDIIMMGLKVPGIKINREAFLRKEFFKNFPEEIVNLAIAKNPMQAGIPQEEIEKIVDEVIKFERMSVSGISAALSAPGGVAMAATIPVDIAQYYGYMLRATQKMLYLYGFPEIDLEENGQFIDTETMNMLIICMGVMYGVAGANHALRSVAKALGTGVEKQLMKKALTKGTIYPIVKSVSKWFGVRMTKEVFTGFFKKAIPVVGGIIGGGLTFVTFKPCCDKLRCVLQDTMLSNPNYKSNENDDDLIDVEAVIIEDAKSNEILN